MPAALDVAGDAGAAPWLDAGSALLDAEGRITRLDARLAAWLGAEDATSRGRTFAQALEARCPEAAGPVTALLQAAHPFASATVPCAQTDGGCLRLETARHDGGFVLYCQSVLPPQEELAETGWRRELSGEAARGELFLRLQKAESQIESLTHRWPGVIFAQRPDFSFQFIGPQIEKLTSIAPAEWERSTRLFWQLVHESDAEDLQQHFRRCDAANETLTTTFRLRHAVTGKISHLLEHRRAVRTASGLLLAYEGVWLDITRQTIAERRLSAAAWKETLAMLTMGLAHDFNNILAGISALSESFLEQAGPEHPFTEGLTLIRNNSLHASQLVHRIMSLHRAKTGERSYHNLNETVTEFADLVEKIIPRRIRVAKDLAPQTLALYADAVELRQMVLNLALNAADAMPDRGQITFRTARHTAWTEPEHFVGTRPRLPCVCLEVEDTGCGIPARHLPLLFDPFFTTKPVNKGSGLGLYNARLCAEKHQGGLSVSSTEGRGTLFRIWLPEADFTEAERAETEAGPRRSVLVLGDPGLLLDSTAEFLRSNGYYVVKATGLDQARDLLTAEENNFAGFMILSGPGSSGLTAAVKELRSRHPALKIILQVTGGTAEDLDSELMNCGHLTITNEISETDILRRLQALLRGDSQ